ncbi:hypothetical protein K5X82_08040 [Halosquirtibacter xylanolyticus]|uniref:hypothetical protein n=1 Tax=Halosquirtibacter xylanolyticus TaxID=3374599 RepID=UPI0037497122|nr:hypothetical protein K5X82_08040 [Prolixibacteraceae bacterium]
MKYLSLLFLLILISCNSNKDNITLYLCDIEQDIITVKQTPVEVLNKEPLGHPFFINNIKDKYLVITDIDARDKGLYIYNIDNFKPLGVTGKLGEGPGEISYYHQPCEYKNGFLMKDSGKYQYYYYDITKIKDNLEYLPYSVTKFINTKLFPFYFKMTSDSTYVGMIGHITSNSTYEIEVAEGNIFNDSIKNLIDIPKEIDNHNLQFFFSASNNRIFLNYHYYHLFSIYDTQGKEIKQIYGSHKITKDRKKTHFSFAQTDGKDIYIPYNPEVSMFKDKRGRWDSKGYNKILHFDIDGNYINTLETKEYFELCTILPTKHQLLLYSSKSETPFTTIDYTNL